MGLSYDLELSVHSYALALESAPGKGQESDALRYTNAYRCRLGTRNVALLARYWLQQPTSWYQARTYIHLPTLSSACLHICWRSRAREED